MRFFLFDGFIFYKYVFKNGLMRWVYLLDVLMRNMKFILLFFIEGNDGEEFVFSKGLGGVVIGDSSRRGSLF